MKIHSTKQTVLIILFVILGLIGGALVYYGTNWGPWTEDDSAEYFEAAQNLASGKGLVLIRATGKISPLASRPTLYPLILSIAPLTGVDLLEFARWFDIVLFAIQLILLGLGIFLLLNDPLLAGIITLLVTSSPAFLTYFTSGMTEPLFFVLGTASLILLISYCQTDRTMAFIASALLAGFCTLSRLSGIAIIGTAILGLFLFDPSRFKRRLLNVLIYVSLCFLVLLPWLIGVYQRGYSAGVYDFDFTQLWDRLASARTGFVGTGWTLLPYTAYLPSFPYRVQLISLSLIALAITILIYASLRHLGKIQNRAWANDPYIQTIVLFALFAVLYGLVFIFSHLFMVIPRALVYPRHLSIIEMGALVSLFTAVVYILNSFAPRTLARTLTVILAAGLLFPYAQQSKELLTDLHRNGRGYTSQIWHESELIDFVSTLPDDITLISNDEEAIQLWTYREAFRIPEIRDQAYKDPFERFGDNPDDLVQGIFREEGAALVLFDSINGQFQRIYGDRTLDRLEAFTRDLYNYYEGNDGTVYLYQAP